METLNYSAVVLDRNLLRMKGALIILYVANAFVFIFHILDKRILQSSSEVLWHLFTVQIATLLNVQNSS